MQTFVTNRTGVWHMSIWCVLQASYVLKGPSSQAMTNMPPRSRWCGTEPSAFGHFGLHALSSTCAFTKVSPGTRLLETVGGRKTVRHFGVTICFVVSKQPLYSDDCVASLVRGIRETLIIVKNIRSTATPRKSAPFAELCSRLSFDQMTWTGLFAEAFEAAVTTRSFTVSHHV